MGADDDPDRAVGQAARTRARLGRRAEARELLDPHVEARRSGGGTSRRCWRTRTVVGASTATCRPASAAAAAARSATSVLPKPTSPQTSRSIGGCPRARSASAASIAGRLIVGSARTGKRRTNRA